MGWGEFLLSIGGFIVLALGVAELGNALSRGIDAAFHRAWPPEDIQ